MNRNGQITVHQFYTQDGRIVAETRLHPNGSRDTLEFFYDANGRPVQLRINGTAYNYVLNLQGDVQQIRNAQTGAVVATYLYNAWGELLSISGTRAEINPLRYRGYYFCSTTGFYYLNSRYYCPWIGRFINADAAWVLGVEQGNLLRYNLFTYCLNNPVNGVDPDGYWKKQVAGAFIGALAGGLIEIGRQVIFEGARSRHDILWSAVAIEMAAGAVTGVAMTAKIPANVTVNRRAVINAATVAAHDIANDNVSWGTVGRMAVVGGGTWFFGHAMGITGRLFPPRILHTVPEVVLGVAANRAVRGFFGFGWDALQRARSHQRPQINPGPTFTPAGSAVTNFATPPTVAHLFLSRPT